MKKIILLSALIFTTHIISVQAYDRDNILHIQIEKIRDLIDEMHPVFPDQTHEILYRLNIIDNLILHEKE